MKSDALESVISFNIRCENPHDGENNWIFRKDSLVKFLNHNKPSIIGLQEAVPNQLKYVVSNMPNYEFIGKARDRNGIDEFNPILYNKNVFELIEHNTFWLSETPQTPSIGWDAALERICTNGKFLHRLTKEIYYVFNTHLDHKGIAARSNGINVILDKINSLGQEVKLIFMGDFNSGYDSDIIESLKDKYQDSLASSVDFKGPFGTFNEFKKSNEYKNRIDYIFTNNIKVIQYHHIDLMGKNNIFLSDHFPVLLDYKL